MLVYTKHEHHRPFEGRLSHNGKMEEIQGSCLRLGISKFKRTGHFLKKSALTIDRSSIISKEGSPLI
jgi:hypothetical protein